MVIDVRIDVRIDVTDISIIVIEVVKEFNNYNTILLLNSFT